MTEPEYSFEHFLRLQQMKQELSGNISLYQEIAIWLSEGYKEEDSELYDNNVNQENN